MYLKSTPLCSAITLALLGSSSLTAFAQDAGETTTTLDRVEITGTQGRIEFEFFAESPLRLVTADGVQEIALPNPQHVQQPLIQTVVDDLNGQGVSPASAEAALRTTAVVDRILASFRRRAA